MKVPKQLTEKVLSALQISKLTGEIKTGLFETMRAMEAGKAKYIFLSTDTKPTSNRLRKKFAMVKLLSQDKNIFCFEISTKKALGNIVGLDVGVSCIAIIKPDRAESLFKSAVQEMKEIIKI